MVCSDLLVLKVTWVLLVLMVRLVLKEIVEKQREDKRCLILCQRVTKENLVPLALVVFQVVLGLRVTLDFPALPVILALKAIAVCLDSQDHLENVVCLVFAEIRVIEETLVFQAKLVFQALMVSQVFLGLKVTGVKLADRLLDYLDSLVLLDHLVLKVTKVKLVFSANLVYQV